jgi:hypothetical protein
MTHLTTRLAVRALFAIVMQTEVHAAENLTVCRTVNCGREPELRIPDSVNTISMCLLRTDGIVTCQYADQPTCSPGHEQACQQRDHGASPYQGRGR